MVTTVPVAHEYTEGPQGSGFDADALLGTVPAANLPASRILPDVSGLSSSDDGDVLLVDGSRWIRGGFANGIQSRFRFDDATSNVVFDWLVTPHQRDVFAAFLDGGWGAAADAEIGTTIKAGTAAHTAGEITGLTYAASRTQPSPATGNSRIAIRVPIARQADADAGRFRAAERDSLNDLGEAPETGTANRVTTDAAYAYYSVQFTDLAADEVTRPEELTPFELDPRYATALSESDRAIIDGFSRTEWTDAAADAMALSQPSTTAFNASIQSVAFAASQTVTSQAQPFHVGVRVPLADKDRIARFRIAVAEGTETTYRAVTAHVSDTAQYSFFQVRFPASTATQMMRAQALQEHRIDPDVIRIDFTDLQDAPDALGAQGTFVAVGASGLEFVPNPRRTISSNTPLVASGSGAPGDGTEVSAWNHRHPEQTIATSTIGSDVRTEPDTEWSINVPVVGTWYQGTAFNIEAGKTYYAFWNPPGTAADDLNAPVVVRGDDLRRLPSQTVGQTGAGVTTSIPVGTLQLGRNAANELIWSATKVTTGGSLRFAKQESAGVLDPTAIPDAVYWTPDADVDLPVPNAVNSWGAWTTIREIIDNTAGTETKKYSVGMLFSAEADWAGGGGERAAAEFHVEVVNASDVVQRTPVDEGYTYIRNGASAYYEAAKEGHWSVTLPIDLAPGEKVRVQGRGVSQTAGAGRNITLAADHCSIWYREEAVLQGASQQRQTISTRPNYVWFYRRVTGGTTPTFAGQYDGTSWRNLGGWTQTPGGVIPAGAGALWHARATVTYDESTTFDWNVSATVYPDASIRYSRHQFPTQPSDILDAPPTGDHRFFISSYEGGGQWSPFAPVLSDIGGWEEVTSRSWYPGSFADFYSDTFTEFSFLDYEQLLVVASIYGPNGNDLVDRVEFPISLTGGITTTETGHMPRTPTATSTLYFFYRHGDRHQWAMSDRAQDSGVASFYDRIGGNMRFERNTGEAGDSRCNRITVFNPATFDSMRRVRFGIALFRR